MKLDADALAVRADFIEKTGMITQAEGLPRIAGRVFGMLIFDGDLVSFEDLATRLQVSRASISTSIRILEERGLIKRMENTGRSIGRNLSMRNNQPLRRPLEFALRSSSHWFSSSKSSYAQKLVTA